MKTVDSEGVNNPQNNVRDPPNLKDFLSISPPKSEIWDKHSKMMPRTNHRRVLRYSGSNDYTQSLKDKSTMDHHQKFGLNNDLNATVQSTIQNYQPNNNSIEKCHQRNFCDPIYSKNLYTTKNSRTMRYNFGDNPQPSSSCTNGSCNNSIYCEATDYNALLNSNSPFNTSNFAKVPYPKTVLLQNTLNRSTSSPHRPPPRDPPPPPFPPTAQFNTSSCATTTTHSHPSTLSTPTQDSSWNKGKSKKKKHSKASANLKDSEKDGTPIFCCQSWPKSAIVALILCLTFIFIFLVYFLIFNTGSSSENVYLNYYKNNFDGILYEMPNIPHPILRLSSNSAQLNPLPTRIYLGQKIQADLPSRRIVYTQINIQQNAQIWFNVTLAPRAKLVLYARLTLAPTPAVYDFQRIITADKLHVNGKRMHSDNLIVKHALISHFMVSGRWFLGFLNDDSEIQSIEFVTGISDVPLDEPETNVTSVYSPERVTCSYDCFGKGTCRRGKCHCYPGYSGKFCEETACPVLCSGNGLFNNGACICHDGYKGLECEITSNTCEQPDCNGHGYCTTDGLCQCQNGWTGEFCEEKNCDGKCSLHGICIKDKCYCESGYYGESCEHKIARILDLKHLPLSHNSQQMSQLDQNKFSLESIETTTKPTCSCLNGGKCISNVCHCSKEWTGSNCQISNAKNFTKLTCAPGCEKHGKCNSDGHCECEKGWIGENCFIEACPNNCNKVGECIQIESKWKCECDSSHFGLACEYAKETECNDGIDNDNGIRYQTKNTFLDGLVDCEDSSECCSKPACSTSPMCMSEAKVKEAVNPETMYSSSIKFFDKIQFLINENTNIQRYAQPEVFDEKRVSVLRGRILSQTGGPLNGVRVSSAETPAHGFSLSRRDSSLSQTDENGQFDLVVNGGDLVKILFVRQPYGKLLKSFHIPWNEVVNVGDVYMDKSTNETNAEQNCKYFKQLFNKFLANCSFFNNIQQQIKIQSSWQSMDNLSLINTTLKSTQNIHQISNFSIQQQQNNNSINNKNNNSRLSHKSILYFQFHLNNEWYQDFRLLHFHVQIAGREFHQVFTATQNDSLEWIFIWDQRNVYGQMEFGLVNAYSKFSIDKN